MKEEIEDIIKTFEQNPYYNFCDISTFMGIYRLYGKEELKVFCKLNAFKYRMRAGKKEIDSKKDIEKALCYEEFYKKLL